LKQFVYAFTLYIDDNSGFYPNFYWNNQLNDYLNPGGKCGWTSDKGVLLPVARCPSIPNQNYNFPIKMGYAYTGVWWNDSHQNFFACAYSSQTKLRALKVSQVMLPEEKCVVNEKWSWHGAQYWGVNYLNDQTSFSPHMTYYGNFLFADSHVNRLYVGFCPMFGAGVQWAFDPMYMPRVDKHSSHL
ncbi:MAG: hypothetical protein D6820_12235, partial [Lentisphaerae bacterium]